MPGGFDGEYLDFPQGDANAGGREQYQKENPPPKSALKSAPESALKSAPEDDSWWIQRKFAKLMGKGAGTNSGVKKTTGTIGKKGGGRRTRGRRTRDRRTRGRRTRDRVPRKTKPHRTKRASSNRGSDWRSHIKRTMKNNPNMKFGKDLLKLASRTFKKGVKPIYS
jgi:hypothetical protein